MDQLLQPWQQGRYRIRYQFLYLLQKGVQCLWGLLPLAFLRTESLCDARIAEILDIQPAAVGQRIRRAQRRITLTSPELAQFLEGRVTRRVRGPSASHQNEGRSVCELCSVSRHLSRAEGPRQYSTAEAARLLGLTARQAGDWCRKGRFPNASIHGGRWSIPASDLEPFAG